MSVRYLPLERLRCTMTSMSQGKVKEIVETNLGIYVWMMPDGKLIGDGESNYLSIASEKDDSTKIAHLRHAAHEVLRGNGINPCGAPYFMPGNRKITDEEYADQLMRFKSGLVPDEYDVASMKESLAAERRGMN